MLHAPGYRREQGGAVLLALVLTILAGPNKASGQAFTATMQGTVRDVSEGLVAGASVLLINEKTGVRAEIRSSERGSYFIGFVQPGAYRLEVSAKGFQTFLRTGLDLQVQQQATVDVVLKPGEVTTIVEVAGTAPLLGTVNATLGRVVDNRAVLSLPLGGRGSLDLVVLTPGVVGGPGNTGTNFVSNGTRNSQADVLIDGVSVTGQEPNGGVSDATFRPTVEAIQEFKVQTNSFSAEYGNTGGVVVNMVTRSGSNQFHGTLFEFHQRNNLNANNFFANRVGRPLTEFRRNQFGGVIGGPVVIPKSYDGRNRTFFFAQLEGMRQRSQGTVTTTVPTAIERNGDFSQSLDGQGRLIRIFDPYALVEEGGRQVRMGLPGNRVPLSRMSRVARNAIAFYPNATNDGAPFTRQNNFFNSGSNPANTNQLSFKLDHNLSDRHRFSGRFSRDYNLFEQSNFWGNEMNPFSSRMSTGNTNNIIADYTQTVSPTMMLSLRWGSSRKLGRQEPFADQIDLSKFGFSGPMSTELPPQFVPEGYSAVGPHLSYRVRRVEEAHHAVASLTRILGRHTFKFGGDARLYRLNFAQPGINYVVFNFNRRITMRDPFRADNTEGNGLASFLLGWGSGGAQTIDLSTASASQSYGWFLNDDIQVTKRLSLNIGLRYEYDTPFTERFNRLGWVDLNAASPLRVPALGDLRGGIVYSSDNMRSPFDADTNNFAPRLGLAYQVTGGTVLRAGYGIYYGISPAGPTKFLAQGFTTSTGWQTSLDAGLTQFASLDSPFPNGIAQPIGSSQGLSSFLGQGIGGNRLWKRDWGVKPYYQQWSLSLQRELPGSAVFEVVYSGSRGVHLTFGSFQSINRIDPANWALGDRLNEQVANPFFGIITDPQATLSQPRILRSQLLRPYPQFTGISALPGPPIGNSSYHGLQLVYTKRLSHGLSLSASYTFSKLIDDSSFSGNTGWLGGASGLQSYGNLRLERALSIFHIPQRLVGDFSYALPFGRGRTIGSQLSRWANGILGGWQVNGIVTFQSGSALQPALTGGILPDSGQRANLLGNPAISGPVVDRLNGYLSASAFGRPLPYTLGNAPRTLVSVRGPGISNADLSLFKELHLTADGPRYFQIRAEAFNATNTPRFGNPNMTWGSTAFGLIGGQANGPRAMQLALKFYF